jgi:hypothetical protein
MGEGGALRGQRRALLREAPARAVGAQTLAGEEQGDRRCVHMRHPRLACFGTPWQAPPIPGLSRRCRPAGMAMALPVAAPRMPAGRRGAALALPQPGAIWTP